jgi:Do/DeqQ family serine protease
MSTDRSPLGPARTWTVAGLFLGLGLVVGLALAATLRLQPEVGAQGSASSAYENAAVAPLGEGGDSPFIAVVERALPAVVSIDTRRKVGAAGGSDADEMFRRFFGQPPGGEGGGRRQTVPSSGSGFIIDREGRILTNNHVVRDASEITVTLSDKRTFKAKVIGQDQATDVAVIQISATGTLPVLPLGDSDAIKVGQWVLAIGNPLGELQGSVTAGIVSARGRSSLNIAGGAPDYQDFIQTDASINFGNSGGPLVNLRGEAIGINTAINAQGQGIGFAIPINLVRHVAEQLVANGKVVRGFLGVVPGELTPALAETYGVDSDAGVVVQEVSDDSPASRAGIRPGDIITAFDDTRVRDVTAFRLKVADTPVDKRVSVALLRDGRPSKVTVTLANREVMLAQATGPARGRGGAPGSPESASPSDLGVTVRTLNDDEREVLGNRARGVLVTAVEDDSPAAEAGIEEGDLILEANGRDIASPTDLGTVVRSARQANRPMRVRVGNVNWNTGAMGTGYVAVRLRD